MMTKSNIPKEKCLDSTTKLIKEGYLFIPNRIRKYNSPIFKTKLIGKKAVCMSGEKAAEFFYNQDYFTRKGAVPKRIQESLFGRKAIQTMDGAAHIHRKLLFMSLMTPKQIEHMIDLTEKTWEANGKRWEKKKQVILFDEASKLLFQAACEWAGIPLKQSEAIKKSQDMSAMIDAFGAVGPRHWKGRCARNRSECWVTSIICKVRRGEFQPPKDTALYAIAWHKNLSKQLLEPHMAAIELINVIRPITAIATYITFEALALHMYPQYRNELKKGDDVYRTMFVQEVRRFYPFGPFLGAKLRKDVRHFNYYFKKGDLVFLDIFGTNHDKGIWKYPNIFNPENFRNRTDNPYDFIPQGGGDYRMGTRCPGEWITIELMKLSLDFLVNRLEYDVPLQDFSYCMNRIPTLPKSKFIMTEVKTK